jgi:hypothetical protein
MAVRMKEGAHAAAIEERWASAAQEATETLTAFLVCPSATSSKKGC